MDVKDFPIQVIMEQELRLVAMADNQRERARDAVQGHADSAPGFYESALAYFEAARQTGQTRDYVIAQLDRIAAKQAQQADDPHRWPIDGLENLSTVHRDPGVDPNMFPRWGVADEASAGSESYLTAVPATGGENALLIATSGPLGHGEKMPKTMVLINIGATQWRALNALAERIFAGRPVPYDTAGNYLAQEPTDD